MQSSHVKPISIIAIVLGALGLLSAASSAVMLAVGAGKAQTMFPVPNQTPRMAEVQAEMTQAIAAVTAEWKTYNTVMTALLVLVAISLLVGGIMSVQLREEGRRILASVFIAASVLAILRGVASIAISFRTAELVREWMPRMTQASTAPGAKMPPGADRIVSGVLDAGIIAGQAFAAGWVLLQVAFYVFGVLHLRKPEVKATFHAN